MNTRPISKKGKSLVPTDLAREVDTDGGENVTQARNLYKLLISSIPRMGKDIAPSLYFIDLADGAILLLLLLIVDEKIAELDPKHGLGKTLTHVHDHLMGSLLEMGYLAEEDDSEPDSDEESLPYYVSKTTIADIFTNAESVTESDESKEDGTEEYTGECAAAAAVDYDSDTDTDTTPDSDPGTEESYVSQDIYERDPTSSDTTVISTEYTTTDSAPGSDSVSDVVLGKNPLDSDTGDNDTTITDNTVGSPMVVDPSNVVDPSTYDDISTLELMFLLHNINKK
ncbi:hypothetical protein B484DRAFT_461212 [Ochromonadaceae sp. CCMP2298]|nr:hypothetical protein B484DRAFT_461212 [Ochromonadaceae sp. CCMP2298]